MTEILKLQNTGKIFFSMIAMLSISAVCILEIGGMVGMAVIVLYCIMLFIFCLTVITHILHPKLIGMQIGIIKGPDGNATIDLKLYDQYTYTYEHRLSLIWFWLFIPLTLAWPIIFLFAGFTKLAYIALASIISSEIGKYRVYRAIKENKTAWGGAAYINEIRNFFNKGKKTGK